MRVKCWDTIRSVREVLEYTMLVKKYNQFTLPSPYPYTAQKKANQLHK